MNSDVVKGSTTTWALTKLREPSLVSLNACKMQLETLA
jgi:hypothetical protein